MLLIIRNTLKVTFRKKSNIIIYIFLPLFGILLAFLVYGSAGTTVLRVGVADRDAGVFSDEMKAVLGEAENLKLSDIRPDEISGKLLNSELDAAIEIPEGYSESVYKGSPLKVGVISIKGQETTVWIEQSLNSYMDMLQKISVASGGDKALFDNLFADYKKSSAKLTTVKLEDRVTGRNMAFTSIGMLIMFIMMGTQFVNMIILKEKRDRTYHRICSAPVNARQYIAGNAITSLLIVIVQILFIQLIMKYVVRINTGLNDAALFVILLMFGLVAIGTSLVITAFSSSSYMASTLGTLIMTPTCMLGGCFWDISMMPDIMQKIAYFVPQRWAMNAITRLQTGGAIGDISMNLYILAGFALALILVAIYKFARTNNMQKFV